MFYCLLKWLFSRKVMDTLSGLKEGARTLPERVDRDLFDLLCDKLWLARLIYFIQFLETSENKTPAFTGQEIKRFVAGG